MRGIHKKRKGGRRTFQLHGVVELEPFAGFVGRLALIDDVFQRAVDQRRGNALAPLVIYIANGLQQAVELKAIYGAGENNGCVIEKEKLVLHPLAEFAEGGQAFFAVITMPILFSAVLNFISTGGLDRLGGEVPFIDHHDAGAMVLGDKIRDLFVLLHNAGFGINHQHGNIAALDGGGCAGNTEIFERVFDPTFFAHACGIN